MSWVRELVSSVNASVARLATTPDGGVVALAHVHRTLALRAGEHKLASFEPIGEESVVAFKLDSAGALSWSARIGAPNGSVAATALTTTPEGSIVIGGRYNGAPRIQAAGRPELALPQAPAGKSTDPSRLFLAYFAPDGTPTQVVTSNDVGGSWRNVATIAPLGEDIIVLGSFAEHVSFGKGQQQATVTAIGRSDIFLLRLDPAGEPRWARRIGGAGDDFGNSLDVTQQGSIVVAGSFSKPFVNRGAALPATGMTFGDSAARLEQLSRADAFVAAIGGDGSLAWWQAVGGSESPGHFEGNRVHGLAVTRDGDTLVVGQAAFPLQIGATKSALSVPGATSGGFLARFAGSGTLRTVHSLGSVKPSRIAVLPDGDFVVSAQGDDDIRYVGGKASAILTSAGLTDLVLARHAPDGTLRWATHFGGEGDDWAGPLAVDAQGALYVEGAYHTDFSLERRGCEAVPVHVVARDHPNSFLFRVEPGADPSDAARERTQHELRERVEALRNRAENATQSGDDAGALSAHRQLAALLPEDPRAWVELAAHLEQQEPQSAIEADLRALELGSRHRDVILETDTQARHDAYLSLARLGQIVSLPAGGCERLLPAAGCTASLYACVGDSALQEHAARVGTSAEQASLATDPTLLPMMPALDRYPGTNAADFAFSHHWFERADRMDVLLSDDTTDCRIVTADACLGLIGVVCESHGDNGGDPNTTVDEFYLWREEDRSLPADP